MVITKSGITPNTLTIQKGQNVTFKDGDKGIYAVKVGGLDGVTVTGGLIETYTFPEAGTYDVVEELTSNTATITVQ